MLQDNNKGLVFQVLGRFHSSAVLKLGRSFAALTMADVATRASINSLSVEDIESFITSLIASRDVDAALFHSPYELSKATLRFSTKSLKFGAEQEAYVRESLHQEAHSLRSLVDVVVESGRVLEFSSEYIESLRRTQRRADNGAKGNTDVSVGFKTNDFDEEDMMADLN